MIRFIGFISVINARLINAIGAINANIIKFYSLSDKFYNLSISSCSLTDRFYSLNSIFYSLMIWDYSLTIRFCSFTFPIEKCTARPQVFTAVCS